jgi:RIO-like serine/threonine protein kinase
MEIKFEKAERLDEGTEAVIYKSGALVAKVLHNSQNADSNVLQNVRERLTKEYEIARDLYESKISVPKPFGVFDLPFENGKKCPAFIMQYIDGKNLSELMESYKNARISLRLYDNAKELAAIQIEAAKKIGLVPYDANAKGNIMLSKSGRIYLIDFGQWQRVNPRR